MCRWGFPKPRPATNDVGVVAARSENGCKAFVNDYRTDAVAAMFEAVLVKSGLYDSNHLGIDAEAITTPDTAPLLLCRRSDKVVVR